MNKTILITFFLFINFAFTVTSSNINYRDINVSLNDSIRNITNSTREDINSTSLTVFTRSLFMNLFSELGDKSSICIVILFKEVTPLTLFIVASSVETLFNLGNSFIGYEISSFVSLIWIKMISFVVFLFFGASIFYQILKNNEQNKENNDHKIIVDYNSETVSYELGSTINDNSVLQIAKEVNDTSTNHDPAREEPTINNSDIKNVK